jgi:hypothetical protein
MSWEVMMRSQLQCHSQPLYTFVRMQDCLCTASTTTTLTDLTSRTHINDCAENLGETCWSLGREHAAKVLQAILFDDGHSPPSLSQDLLWEVAS